MGKLCENLSESLAYSRIISEIPSPLTHSLAWVILLPLSYSLLLSFNIEDQVVSTALLLINYTDNALPEE